MSLEMLTEPIMDASYLDDEINTVNDEFSSWKLINDHHQPLLQGYHRRRGGGPYPLLLGGTTNTTTTTYENNNNNILQEEVEEEFSFQQHYQMGQEGETIASITGSILEQLDFDDDDDEFDEESIQFDNMTTNTSSSTTTTNTSSLHNTRLLFPTPLNGQKSERMELSNFSTDSLDKSTLMSKLKAINNNMDNYTIAFQSSFLLADDQELLDGQGKNRLRQKMLTQSWSPCSGTGNATKLIWSNCDRFKFKSAKNNKKVQTVEEEKKIVMCYPNYGLPDLQFLKHEHIVGQQKELLQSEKLVSSNNKDFKHVQDWESLRVLLPEKYRGVIKPLEEREKEDESEKEVDDLLKSSSSCSNTTAKEENGLVIYRKKKQSPENPHKRLSSHQLGDNSKRLSSEKRFKRFSLQEIEEITEITRNIEDTLRKFDNVGGESEDNHIPSVIVDNKEKHVEDVMNPNQRFLELTEGIRTSISRLSTSSVVGKTTVYSKSNGGKLVLEGLCPALYSLLSDGLTPFIDTIFGKVPNTVWRVVEASIQSGPTAQTLSELVLRINSEEMMAEGPIKFNAFICGLLNLRTLSSWLQFLRSKDRLLRTHYSPTGFLYSINTSTRLEFDGILANTSSLAKTSYTLDIFYELKLLHSNLLCSSNISKKASKHSLNYEKKRSQMKRSFSDERPKKHKKQPTNLLPKSKTQQNIQQQLQQQEVEEAVEGNNKFKKLQLQWERMSVVVDNTDQQSINKKKVTSPTTCVGSKIPRPIVNVRPSSAYFKK